METSGQALSASVSRRTFTLRSIGRPKTTNRETGDSTKGPIGLTTLFEPSQQEIADLVFVHGLNGGSYSTWTQDGDASNFWPQRWLPEDEAFRDARIHTFGYNSSWAQESVLDIHDFASSLLLSIRDCPKIPHNEWAPPLILVGHSMGGLVIKKAYILSRQRRDLMPISERVCSIYFLATPHHGSDLADVLTRVLAISGERPFVKELQRNSPTIQAINNEFPTYAENLKLYSFFETRPMGYGIGKGLIVEKELAQLKYANETSQYLDANHRDVARFSSQHDPSYVSIRNSLAATMDALRRGRHAAQQRRVEDQRRSLDTFLGVSGAPENVLTGINRAHLTGSSRWLLEKGSFVDWRDSHDSSIFWLQGKPGAGKSVLSTLVINNLRSESRDKNCCFYFFMHSDRPQCSVAAFLLSWAWQLASAHQGILAAVCDAAKLWKGSGPGLVDYEPIWQRLFLDKIFKERPKKLQCLLIDGLDECKAPSELLVLLVRAQEIWPLPIFITSRNSFDAVASFGIQPRIITEQLRDDEVQQDISRFIQHNLHYVPAADEAARAETAQQILEKSSGCFLWARLVFAQLQGADSTTDAQKIIESVPSDMNILYRRILDSMLKEDHGRPLAKAILKWATYSSRPLAIEELRTALEMDLDDTIPDVEKAVARRCGGLVQFDEGMRLRPVHLTARDFLSSHSEASELTVTRSAGHTSLAMTCLTYLCSSALRPATYRRSSAEQPHQFDRSSFIDYASTAVFDHIARAAPCSSDLIKLLVLFLDSPNVITWIEYIAARSRLSRLLQAGQTLSRILKQITLAGISGISKDTKTMEDWSIDLIRLVSKFGRQLRTRPNAIHSQIAPFCPQESIMYRRFASYRDLHLVGCANPSWDDCSSVITLGKGEIITSVACSDNFFVLGTMLSREIVLYDDQTYQEIKKFSNGEASLLLSISSKEKYLASAGPKSISIWAVDSGEVVSCITTPIRCMSLAFIDNDETLLISMTNNEVAYWNIEKDEPFDQVRWTSEPQVQETFDKRWPTMAAASTKKNLLAIVYRSQDLLVWNFDQQRCHDVYSRDFGSRLGVPDVPSKKSTILALTFSAARESHALVASYFDGELVLYDTEQGVARHRVPAVNAQCLSSSRDGRTLATGDATGIIQLFDLETLNRLYRITFNADFLGVRGLSFTADDLRLLDIRGKQCRVWEPRALLRQELDDDDSDDAISLSTATQDVEFGGDMDVIQLTTIALVGAGQYIVCGNDDGSLYLHDTARGERMQKLFNHGTAVTFTMFDDLSKVLVSADQSSTILGHRLCSVPTGSSKWIVEKVFQLHVDGAISQILGNHGLTRLLICTSKESLLYELADFSGTPMGRLQMSNQTKGLRWSGHPIHADKLILFLDNRVHMFSWDRLQLLCDARLENVTLDNDPRLMNGGMILESVAPSVNRIQVHLLSGSGYLITIHETQRWSGKDVAEILLWRADSIKACSGSIQSIPGFAPLSTKVQHIIGTFHDRLIYLHEDGWIWSAPLDKLAPETATPHFFIPADWLSLNNGLSLKVTANGDVVFPRGSELVIAKRGLVFERPSLLQRAEAGSKGSIASRGLSSRRGSTRGLVSRNELRRASNPHTSHADDDWRKNSV